jgi:MSHA biogenesis protein MshK
MTGKVSLKRLPGVALAIALSIGVSAPAHALKDPTRPPGFQSAPSAPVTQTAYALNSIMIGEERRIAIINGEPVREGEALADARINSIHHDHVVLQVDGAERVLRWTPPPNVRVAR